MVSTNKGKEMKLYPDQQAGKELIIESAKRGNKRIGFAAPCSFGKTVLMSNLVEGALAKNKQTWVVVDSIELIDQTRKTLHAHGIKSGVIQGEHEDTNYGLPVQVVTAQTITRRWRIFDMNPHWLPDLVLIDEFHIQYKAHKELIAMLPKALVIGFSATPTSKGLGLVYQDLVVGSTVSQLLADDRLSPIKAYACMTPDMKGVKVSKGDYAVGETEKKVNTTKIRGDLVSNWGRLANGRKTIVFCVNVKHSLDVLQEFIDNDIPARQIDGRTYKGIRKETIEDFRNSEFQVLISVGTLIKGFDVVDVGCIIDAQPTRSLARHIQKIGRGMRKNSVYSDCLILDHAGNLLRNGFPEDYQPEELCMGERGENKDAKQPEEKLPSACPACGAIKPPKVHVCPRCKFAPERPSNVENDNATLSELKRKQTPAEKRNKEHSNEFKKEMWSAFQQLGNSKGHSSHLYKGYYGVFPKMKDGRHAGEKAMDTAKNFKRAKQIAWAKSKHS